MTSGNFFGWDRAFPRRLLPLLFKSIVDEWPRFVRPRCNLENRITHRFVGHLQVTLRGSVPFGFYARTKKVSPDSDTETAEVDITVHHGVDPLVFFGFECKRLNVVSRTSGKKSSNASAYIGSDGMQCFTSGRYQGGGTCGGMIGYVMDNAITNARTTVERGLQREAGSLNLIAPHCFQPAGLGRRLSNVLLTRHSFRSGVFDIYHIFLPVRPSTRSSRISTGVEMRRS